MTSQQFADHLLDQHRAEREARMRLAGIRENDLASYYAAERRKGVDVITANIRMGEHGKFLDREYERDLQVIRDCIGRVT